MSKREFKIGDLVSSSYGPGGKITKAIIVDIAGYAPTYTLQIQEGNVGGGWEDRRWPGKRHWNVNEFHLKWLGPPVENNQFLLDF